jgi:hypothetical protein
MTISDTIQTVFTAVASIGFSSAIVYAVVRFSANKIADRLQSKYQLKLNKELENLKSKNSKTIYVSKVRFDAEFKIYRKLCKSFWEIYISSYSLYPFEMSRHYPLDISKGGIENEKQQENLEYFNKTGSNLKIASNCLHENAPFIPSHFYKNFENILS